MIFTGKISKIMNRGQSRSIILGGNIYDLYWNGKSWVPLMQYLSDKYNVKSTDERRGIVIVRYELNDDIEIIGEGRPEVIANWNRVFDKQEKPLDECISNTHKNSTYAFELMRMLSLCSRKSANRRYDILFLIEGADMLLPEEEISRMNLADRRRIAITQDWFSDPDFVNGSDTAILFAESRSLIHHRVSRLPQVLTVQVDSPDYDERLAYINHSPDYAGERTPTRLSELATQTAGLSLYAVRQILRNGEITSEVITERVEEYIGAQLGDGVVEFKKPSHKLEKIIGFSKLKEFARKELIPRFQATDESALTGCAVGGAIGGGKTFFFEAVAAELGMPVLVLKNLRSQWFGQTDVIFERFHRAITALDKVAIFIDEADTAFGKIQGGHETERRLTGKIQAMMSDPRLKGKVIWMLMTARIHLLSPDIRRPGRVGDLIIPILDPDGQDRNDFINWTFGHLIGFGEEDHAKALESCTKDFSAASFAGLRSQIKAAKCRTIEDALSIANDLLPPDIEDTRRYQTLQALVNCTRVSLLPEIESKSTDKRHNIQEQRKKWHEEIARLESKGIE